MRNRTWLVVSLVVLICSALLWRQRPESAAPKAEAAVLQAEGELRWFRGNLHTHTFWSDGDDFPEMVALWYKEHGYDFLCLTDHNLMQRGDKTVSATKHAAAVAKLKARFPEDWVDEREVGGQPHIRLKTYAEFSGKVAEAGKFLMLPGEEISDKFKGIPIHLNASNLQEPIPPMGGNSVYEVLQNDVNAVIAQRERTGQPMIVHVNHPNFGFALTAEDLMRVRGENFFEVYNGHPSVYNGGAKYRASTDRLWDIMLTFRLAELQMPVMYGLAVDDSHNYHRTAATKGRGAEPGRGWIMVLAKELTPESLIAAMERGEFYASSGVFVEQVVSSAKGLDVRVRREPNVTYAIEFIGTKKNFEAKSEPIVDQDGKPVNTTRKYSREIGQVFKRIYATQAKYEFTGDELYVRARITSSRKHPNPSETGEYERAWIQPVVGPAAPPPPAK